MMSIDQHAAGPWNTELDGIPRDGTQIWAETEYGFHCLCWWAIIGLWADRKFSRHPVEMQRFDDSDIRRWATINA